MEWNFEKWLLDGSGAVVQRYEDGTDVMELEADDFAGALETNPFILVQFYAPDSGAYKAT